MDVQILAHWGASLMNMRKGTLFSLSAHKPLKALATVGINRVSYIPSWSLCVGDGDPQFQILSVSILSAGITGVYGLAQPYRGLW